MRPSNDRQSDRCGRARRFWVIPARIIGTALSLWLGGVPSVHAASNSSVDHCFLGLCPSPPNPELFGTHETISHNLTDFVEWRNVMARSETEFAAARGVCTPNQNTDCVPETWTALLAALRGKPLRRQIEIANNALDRVRYVLTTQNWHRARYWETPFEFLRYGGQCQDYAIAKYELLRQAGVPASAMRMVVLHDAAIDRDHAVLVVYVEGEPLVLDNLNPSIVPADASIPYQPYYSINENAWWYHFGPHSMEGWRTAVLSR